MAAPTTTEIAALLREARERLARLGENRGIGAEFLLRIDRTLQEMPGTLEWNRLHPAA